jgi:hypothetical protein
MRRRALIALRVEECNAARLAAPDAPAPPGKTGS